MTEELPLITTIGQDKGAQMVRSVREVQSKSLFRFVSPAKGISKATAACWHVIVVFSLIVSFCGHMVVMGPFSGIVLFLHFFSPGIFFSGYNGVCTYPRKQYSCERA
jgi:ABC-type multidrug transport system permease subunit